MKTVNDKNQIWFERSNDVVTVGFTKSFLDSLDQCWHILPAHLQKFREKAPLMVVETNDNLISILSPVSAHFATWSDKAQNFPYKLTEGDVVLEMNMVQALNAPRRPAATNPIMPAAPRAGRQANPAAQVAMHWDEAPQIDPVNAEIQRQRAAIEARQAEIRAQVAMQQGGLVRGRRPAGTF